MSKLLNNFDPVREFVGFRDNLTNAISNTLKLPMRDKSFPALNIYIDQNGDLVIQTESIANLDKKSVEVIVENDVLTVSGTILESSDENVTYLLEEIPSGFFSRSVTLLNGATLGDIRAHVNKSGVISIRFSQK